MEYFLQKGEQRFKSRAVHDYPTFATIKELCTYYADDDPAKEDSAPIPVGRYDVRHFFLATPAAVETFVHIMTDYDFDMMNRHERYSSFLEHTNAYYPRKGDLLHTIAFDDLPPFEQIAGKTLGEIAEIVRNGQSKD